MGQLTIYMSVILDCMASAMITPIMPSINRSIGLSTAMLAMISSFLSLVVFACSIFHGKATETFGKLLLLKLSTLSQLISYLSLLIAITIPNKYSFYIYIIGRLIPSIFKCNMIVSQAYLIDTSTSTKESVKWIGQLNALANATFVISPLIGGYLSTLSKYLPIKLGIIICVINVCLLIFQRDEKRFDLKSPKRNDKSFFKDCESNHDNHCKSTYSTDFHTILILKFIFQTGNFVYESLFAQQLQDKLMLSPKAIGWFFSLSGATSTFVNGYLMPKLFHSSRSDDTLLYVTAGQAVGLLIWGSCTSIYCSVLSTIIISICSNIFLSISHTMIAVRNSHLGSGSSSALSLSTTVD
mmetsp:Transcript_21764/g.19833  ORF Transcript_21764/g.19833 Transcript_21764/m.19833 type:complete len:354 (-) Transcript_21764:241-1302(-)